MRGARSTESYARPAIGSLAIALVVGMGIATADVPPDSDWQVIGTERVVARVRGRRFVTEGLVDGVLAVDLAGNWTMDVFEGTSQALTVGGSIEERRGRRFAPRMDAASKAAFGEAVRQLMLDQGVDSAEVKRVSVRMRGRERDEDTLRIRSVARFRLRVREARRSLLLTLRATDRWTCSRIR